MSAVRQELTVPVASVVAFASHNTTHVHDRAWGPGWIDVPAISGTILHQSRGLVPAGRNWLPLARDHPMAQCSFTMLMLPALDDSCTMMSRCFECTSDRQRQPLPAPLFPPVSPLLSSPSEIQLAYSARCIC